MECQPPRDSDVQDQLITRYRMQWIRNRFLQTYTDESALFQKSFFKKKKVGNDAELSAEKLPLTGIELSTLGL